MRKLILCTVLFFVFQGVAGAFPSPQFVEAYNETEHSLSLWLEYWCVPSADWCEAWDYSLIISSFRVYDDSNHVKLLEVVPDGSDISEDYYDVWGEYVLENLAPGTNYTLCVTGVDLEGNESSCFLLSVKTLGEPVLPPSIPIGQICVPYLYTRSWVQFPGGCNQVGLETFQCLNLFVDSFKVCSVECSDCSSDYSFSNIDVNHNGIIWTLYAGAVRPDVADDWALFPQHVLDFTDPAYWWFPLLPAEVGGVQWSGDPYSVTGPFLRSLPVKYKNSWYTLSFVWWKRLNWAGCYSGDCIELFYYYNDNSFADMRNKINECLALTSNLRLSYALLMIGDGGYAMSCKGCSNAKPADPVCVLKGSGGQHTGVGSGSKNFERVQMRQGRRGVGGYEKN